MNEMSERARKELWERSTLAMVGHDLGVTVEHWDVGSRQGAPDGQFNRGPRVGYVEVTTLADPVAMAGEAVYLKRFAEWRPGDLTWSFTVNIAPDVDANEFERHLPELARAMEQHRIADPLRLLDLNQIVGPETARWCEDLLEAGRLNVHASPRTSRPGTIYAVPAMGSGGMVADDPNVILPAVAQTMTDSTVLRRLAKLDSTGDTEQHIVIIINNGMWDWAPTYFLTTRQEGVPDSPPAVPAHLDGLWLFATMNRVVLRWIRSAGWAWVPFPALDTNAVESTMQ